MLPKEKIVDQFEGVYSSNFSIEDEPHPDLAAPSLFLFPSMGQSPTSFRSIMGPYILRGSIHTTETNLRRDLIGY
jgi:hypothetical protein